MTRGAALLCIGAILWAGWTLWTHRWGTPGDAVGLYRQIYNKAMHTNSYVKEDAKDFPRRILLVDLSESILTGEEKEELLGLLREDWPQLEVKDAVPEARGVHGRPGPSDEGASVRLGDEEVLLDSSVMIYAVHVSFWEPFPAREELGVHPIPVGISMEIGGWDVISTDFMHYPEIGWRESGRAQVFAHS